MRETSVSLSLMCVASRVMGAVDERERETYERYRPMLSKVRLMSSTASTLSSSLLSSSLLLSSTLRVCVYVCCIYVYICIYVRMCVCLCVCMYACMYMCVYVCHYHYSHHRYCSRLPCVSALMFFVYMYICMNV